MQKDTGALFEEITRLLDAPARGVDAPPLADVEHTLTSGYAVALALEAERWRLERQLSAAVTQLASDAGAEAQELGSLAKRLHAADGELARLRNALGTLRDRAGELRATTA